MTLTLTWEALNIIGTLAFAISGALVAMEEDYDILGVFVLGVVTAFGGGLIRNLLIGIPLEIIWNQEVLFGVAVLAISIVFILPSKWIRKWQMWVILFDAIGLGAFAIQGANYAVSIQAPFVAVIIAATLTGTGGGMLRDLLAGRKPMIFQKEIYALWAILGGLVIGLNLIEGPYTIFILLPVIVILRMLSVYFNWNLPREFKWNDK
ncbi:trimeric intracellular cation channel family protein [Chungangia koreensis]|uniref:Trimeric intracellular cation channel family protein n=1 Tax=Chungangia koreensis TaxID=752657 RepID=A0ABV8X2S7_9LACT